MPPDFTNRLSELSSLEVKKVEQNDILLNRKRSYCKR